MVEIAPPGTDTPLLHNVQDGTDAKSPPAMPLDKLADQAIAGIVTGMPFARPVLSMPTTLLPCM
ncbi:hypothetical protein [Pseudomonas cichorii]|uniref:hypothetical protein n=1 Tax=Pseudomonas cichorii TaxID=36746 RepID=UPI001C8A14A4|nr:hypothetical protein [Pseudomonas cichorii]MBX8576678.1 hypothetical protein [Pseudomonas cichorii]